MADQILFQEALDRLSNPDADLNALRAELAVVLKGIKGEFERDPTQSCEGLTLWRHPTDTSKSVRVRNGILTCHAGASHMISLEELWQVQTSQEEPRVELPIGHVFPCQGEDFHFGKIQEGLEEIIGCPLTSSVKMGFDNFFHYVFRRQFRAYDRQRLKAEQVVTFMQDWDIAMGSYVVVHTARIEVVCKLFPKEMRDEERARG